MHITDCCTHHRRHGIQLSLGVVAPYLSFLPAQCPSSHPALVSVPTPGVPLAAGYSVWMVAQSVPVPSSGYDQVGPVGHILKVLSWDSGNCNQSQHYALLLVEGGPFCHTEDHCTVMAHTRTCILPCCVCIVTCAGTRLWVGPLVPPTTAPSCLALKTPWQWQMFRGTLVCSHLRGALLLYLHLLPRSCCN